MLTERARPAQIDDVALRAEHSGPSRTAIHKPASQTVNGDGRKQNWESRDKETSPHKKKDNAQVEKTGGRRAGGALASLEGRAADSRKCLPYKNPWYGATSRMTIWTTNI